MTRNGIILGLAVSNACLLLVLSIIGLAHLINMDRENQVSDRFIAAYYGRNDILEPWLKAGGNPDEEHTNGMTLLQYATSEHGSFEVVAELLRYGADPNKVSYSEHGTPLQRAAENGSYGTFVLLLEYGADPNYRSDDGVSIKDVLENQEVPHQYEKLRFLRKWHASPA